MLDIPQLDISVRRSLSAMLPTPRFTMHQSKNKALHAETWQVY